MEALREGFAGLKTVLKTRINSPHQAFYTNNFKYIIIILAGIIFILSAGFAFYGHIWAGIFFLPYLPIFCKKNFRIIKEKEKVKMQDEFIDALTAMTFSIQAGYSPENSILQAAREMEKLHGQSKMTKELKKAYGHVSRNESPEKVFEAMGQRLDIDEIKEFAAIFECAKKTGGSLNKVMRRTAEHMKEKQDINREIKTLISGKKLEQKILCIMPLAIILYLKVGAESFISPMYNNLTGIICMSMCACVYIGAVIWAEKITDISI